MVKGSRNGQELKAMRIEILQAGTGDSIWISHNQKNIIIDGGKSTSAIKDRYDQMPQDESRDLLVVTHIDSDHIAGAIALVEYIKEKNDLGRLKEVWFNYPKKEKTNEYSVNEGNELSDLLSKIDGLNWNNNTSELLGRTFEIGDLKLQVLAPDHDVAYEYKPEAPKEMGAEQKDWEVELKTLIEYVDDDNLDEGGPNSQSIVILVECDGKKALFPGDCTPKELNDAVHAYNNTHGTPLKLELMKLPHHGSTKNVTKKIINEIDCQNFAISTKKNNKYVFPQKETIAKLICYRNSEKETINVFFNYEDALDALGITEEEQNDYNIRLSVCREFSI